METTYFFEIQNKKFAEAVDIFREFFLSPLLDKAFVDKEMKAVDSEFRNCLTSDPHRFLQILRSLSSENSSFNKFHIGNQDTLGLEDIYQRLKAFYEREYRYQNNGKCKQNDFGDLLESVN